MHDPRGPYQQPPNTALQSDRLGLSPFDSWYPAGICGVSAGVVSRRLPLNANPLDGGAGAWH